MYVLEESENKSKSTVEQRVCLEVLQKPSLEKMREKKAVLSNRQSENGDKDFVYTDSAFSLTTMWRRN